MNARTTHVILFADVGVDEHETAVEALFKDRADLGVQCQKFFFSKSVGRPEVNSAGIVLPYRFRRRGLVSALQHLVDLDQYQVVVVRNMFSVVSQLQKRLPDKLIGFWESFPHSHRRLEQAHLEKRAVLRKTIEYFFVSRRERRLIEACDFYMPITHTHKKVFYPNLKVPAFATPMGFDFEQYTIPKPAAEKSGPIRFVYIGSIDALRRLDILNRAFLAQDEPFQLDYYSGSQNRAVDEIRAIDDARIQVHDPLARQALFETIASADVGICFFPHTKTYITASPTKTIEYGALGLSVLVNPMPEYRQLIDESCAYICDFDEESIHWQIQRILRAGRSDIITRGRRLQARVRAQRDYVKMATQLFAFIQGRQHESGNA